MASGLILVSGSPLVGSPIIYKVTAATISGNCAFHRVNLVVKAALSVGATDWVSLTLSSPAESGEQLQFDVSSALRAVADRYVYSPTPPDSYPFIKYSLSASDEYMQNGELHENVGKDSTEGGNVIMGAYSDFERVLAQDSKLAQHFTRKPNTIPEVVMVGETMVCPQSFTKALSEASITKGPVSEVVNITKVGLQTINGRRVYALPTGQTDRYQFRFVNGLGCLESISLSSLRVVEMNCTQESFIRAVQETFGSFSRGLITKKNDYETWKMSTPPLDMAWQSWFMHEFLMAKFVWINIDNHWIPCHIIPEETSTGVNKVESSLLTVTFSVQLDMNGSPMLALTV